MDKLLRPAYEKGDGSMDGAQQVNCEWYHPLFGCDSLQIFLDNLPNKLTAELIEQVEKRHLEDVGDGYGKAIFDAEAFAKDLIQTMLESGESH